MTEQSRIRNGRQHSSDGGRDGKIKEKKRWRNEGKAVVVQSRVEGEKGG